MLSSNENQRPYLINEIDMVTFCSLLALSKPLDVFSTLLTMLALTIGLLTSQIDLSLLVSMDCLVVFMIGLVEKYYALRIAFDKKLFAYLAKHSQQLPEQLKQLDHTLANLNLIKVIPSPTRPMTERQKGTMKILKKQSIMLGLQIIALIAVIIVHIIQYY